MPATLPPGPTAARAVQGARALLADRHGFPRLRRRYGDAFTIDVPIFGKAVVLSSPDDVKQLFTTNPALVEAPEPNLGRILGSSSFFSLTGQQHHAQRKLLVPPFHGRRLAAYDAIIERETLREIATWPRGREFPVLPSTMRITLEVILRAVFGAAGSELDRLRDLLPQFVTLGSRLATAPVPRRGLGRWNPWRRFEALRAAYDAIVDELIARAQQDPALDERDDVLALMLQARYDDGSPMTRDEVADQLVTLLSAGHETTAASLAWAVERLRRHPRVLADLVAEVDEDGTALRDATLTEVQRSRPVVDQTARRTTREVQIGRWTIPPDWTVVAAISLLHHDESVFTDPERFDPSRFLGAKPDLYQWVPYGGGNRRCLGATFASREMNIVLRTVLREVSLAPTQDRGERWRSRGVANAPAKGGLAVVHDRRSTVAQAGSGGHARESSTPAT